MMKKVLLAILFFASAAVFAQKADGENPFFTIRGNVGIPRSTGTMMFRNAFSGIYEVNLSFDFKLFSNFRAGVGYQNDLFKVNKRFVYYKAQNGSLSYNTQIITHGGFLRLGYDQFVSKTTYMNYSLNSGMMFANYTSVIADTSAANQPYGPLKFSAPYVQPELSVNFIVGEERLMSLSIMLSYTTQFYKFDPKSPRMNQFSEVYIKENRYYPNWINIGLGFNVLIRGKKGESAPQG